MSLVLIAYHYLSFTLGSKRIVYILAPADPRNFCMRSLDIMHLINAGWFIEKSVSFTCKTTMILFLFRTQENCASFH